MLLNITGVHSEEAKCSVFTNRKYTGATMDVVYVEPSLQALGSLTAPSMSRNLKNVLE